MKSLTRNPGAAFALLVLALFATVSNISNAADSSDPMGWVYASMWTFTAALFWFVQLLGCTNWDQSGDAGAHDATRDEVGQ